MSGSHQASRLYCSFGIGVILLASSAWAQEAAYEGEGPIVLERTRAPERGLYINPAALSLEVAATYQSGSTTSASGTQTSESLLFTQVMTAATSGYYKHPNLFDFNLSLSGGLNEEFSDNSSGQSSNSIGTVYYWNVDATILRVGDWPLTLYSRRQENWIFRDFGGTIRSTSTVTGAAVRHHENDVDTTLDLSHSVISQRGDNEFDNIDYTEDRFAWLSFARLSPTQTLSWNYEYLAVNESGASKNSYATHDATATHEAELGSNGYDTLTSTIHYIQQDSQNESQRFRWTERLRLKHSDELRTRYNYDFDYTDVGGNQRYSNRGEAGFTHYLYKSLTTDGSVGALRSESEGGFGTTELFADLSTNYNKKAPYGIFSANAGIGLVQSVSDGSGQIQVVGLPANFNDPLPIILTGRNIDPNTIILTDPSGLLLVPGADYNVTTFPDRIEINRIIGGRIGTGSTVLIDYVQNPLPASTSETQTLAAGLRYDFTEGALDGLSLYARWAKQDQTITSDASDVFIPNEFTDTIYGTQYRFSDFIVGAEKQEHDSTILPYEATRYFARYVKRNDDTTWSLNATATNIEYPTEDNTVNFYTLSGTATHKFSTRLFGDVTVLYRNENNRLFGDTEGFEEQVQLRWSFRQLDAYFRARASQLTTDSSESNFEFVQIGLIRQF